MSKYEIGIENSPYAFSLGMTCTVAHQSDRNTMLEQTG